MRDGQHRPVMRIRTGLIPAIVWAVTIMGGCAKPEPPPLAYSGPTLASDQLGVKEASCPCTGYRFLETEPTVGRFPLGLAVARLDQPSWWERSNGIPADQWRLSTIPEEQATYWNALFNTVTQVREVIVLDQQSTEAPTSDVRRISQSADRARAGLCLIYGPATADPDHSAFMGVIVDTVDTRPVAYVRAEAGPMDSEIPRPDRQKEDLRHLDVNDLAARKFEKQVWKCVVELIARDRPAATTQPSPWRGRTPRGVEDRTILILPNQPVGW